MITVLLDSTIVSKDALLKTCYWFSRDFCTEIIQLADGGFEVNLSPKDSVRPEQIESGQSDFLNAALDFELRSKVEAQTSTIRELILAKAFAESGVLEDGPQGVFTDAVEEKKTDGLFKILKTESL